jgi:eukaryotic-like serine/threonine-protein kinase
VTDERWPRVKALFQAAVERPPEERDAFLAAAAGEDEALRREVESLLTSDTSDVSFLDRLPVASESVLADPFAALATSMDSRLSHTVLAAGLRVGPYEIVAPLGAGAMGEVYRARDTKLNRIVALKVLPERFALDPDRSARFTREAHLLATLNHPNIAAIYGLEESDPSTGSGQAAQALVLELVDGPTLADRIALGPISLEEALPIARQIADAVEAAHEKGIIHRDLKPANIKIARNGVVKVLDFGLAKVWDGAAQSDLSRSSKLTATHLGERTILGTPAYMSPEQARGASLDPRTDIWSFGCVLYEMLTGRASFAGDTISDTLAAVLDREPDWAALPATVPAAVRTLIRRCLEKNGRQRIADISVAQFVLDDLANVASARAALDAARETSAPRDHKPSIAVLPFANMSADKENEYFGDGLAEEVINALAHIPGLQVAGRTSSFLFRGQDVELSEVGRRLNVEHLLEGSVRRAGNRVRVTAQLIKVADGFHLWSERFDREWTDIFAIQDEITDAIASALRIRLSADSSTTRRHKPNLRAYEAYLKARDLWYTAMPGAFVQTKAMLEHAIALDAQFALPYSLLGGCYTMLANSGLKPAHDVMPLARAAEETALRVDPALPEAHALLGVCAGSFGHDWIGAEREWRLAMAREPISRDVRLWYGNHYLLPIGRLAEAVETMASALPEDPLNLVYRHHYARGLRHLGRLDEAEAELRGVLDLDANFPWALETLGAVCAQQGNSEEALALTERAHVATPWSYTVVGQLAALRDRAGDRTRTDALLETLGTGEA